MGTFVRRWRMADGGIWDMGYGIWGADADCVLQTQHTHRLCFACGWRDVVYEFFILHVAVRPSSDAGSRKSLACCLADWLDGWRGFSD